MLALRRPGGSASGYHGRERRGRGWLAAGLGAASAALVLAAHGMALPGAEPDPDAQARMAADAVARERAAGAVIAPPGEIFDGFAEDVMRALGSSGRRALVIDENPGGDPTISMELARWVHWQGITVKVLRSCMSACADIALASRDLRMAPGAVIGLHSWYLERELTGEILEPGPNEAARIWAEDQSFLGEILGPAAAKEVLRLQRETPPDDIVLLDADDLREIGIAVTVE